MNARSTRNASPCVSDEFLEFTASISYDRRLWRHDIAGSIAHVHGLEEAGVLTKKEKDRIISALKNLAKDIRNGKVSFDPRLEDIHMNIEHLLTERIGEAGAKLHTGRSRNDQVALDTRLMVRETLVAVLCEVLSLQKALVLKAVENKGTIMPGYTHMQHAQPVLLAHHFMAHFWRLGRDCDRIIDCYHRMNVSPLGSGALAGTSFGIDRTIASRLLMMDGITENSLDAVSDRDFVAESAFALSMLMIHLSSLCEELVLWSSQEFAFVRLPKRLASGSSMMPQKLNPDIPELIRGKTGRTVGHLVAILTVLKSLPLAYNRDLQEDKENLFDVFDTVGASLHALTAFLGEMEIDPVRMRESAEAGLMTATDLADFLTTRGIPFRKAHGIVREIAIEADGDMDEFLKLAEERLPKTVKGLKSKELAFLRPERSISRRECSGGTGSRAVGNQLKMAEKRLNSTRKIIQRLTTQVEAVNALLDN